MNNNRFYIFASVKSAYRFVGRERGYLIKISLLPILAQIACALFVQFQRPDASEIEAYLWSLPATALQGWFLFLETRFLLLGERVDALPADPAARARRGKMMEAAVITLVLFNMGVIAAFTALLRLETFVRKAGTVSALAGFGEVAILGLLFWGAQLGIVPILAAVGAPIRATIRRVWGAMFSLRLIGLAVLSVLPVMFLFQIILAFVFAGAAHPAGAFHMSSQQQAMLNIIGAPMSLLASALLNAAGIFALKQIFGGAGKNGEKNGRRNGLSA